MEGDAPVCPMSDESFDVVTMAFGLRNLDSIAGGLREIHRLLKPGGRAAVLEFSHPKIPVFRSLFHFYFTRVLPRIGNAVSGSSFVIDTCPSRCCFPDRMLWRSGCDRLFFNNSDITISQAESPSALGESRFGVGL